MQVLITGSSGFIGFHVSQSLLQKGYSIIGIDNMNAYYDVKLKEDRKKILSDYSDFIFIKGDIENHELMSDLFRKYKFDRVIHLAAQAGVRYSLENPHSYISSNIVGFMNILEGCRHTQVPHLVYASSSSVYGANKEIPFSVEHSVDHPVSLYAATKKSNELMAHCYSHLYNIPTTGLRFFTVYGPWGRPDMALFLFTRAILEDKPIKVFNNGDMYRDFTYVDDIVEGVVRIMDIIPENSRDESLLHSPASSTAPFRVMNIGKGESVHLMEFIHILEKYLGKEARMDFLPMQPGDVRRTWADTSALQNLVGYKPKVSVDEGIRNFVNWYKEYYREI